MNFINVSLINIFQEGLEMRKFVKNKNVQPFFHKQDSSISTFLFDLK